ncbi:polysaccharide deacetylase family protein [Litorivicinus sp.]|nr:polysaccharide deacetylase family protein [Litorivicinus sp.]
MELAGLKSIQCPFGVMFHHFHDNVRHPFVQGSISASDLLEILDILRKEGFRLLSADVFFDGIKKKCLEKTDVCLSFDDALKCQADIALPVLESLNLRAFYFVNSRAVKHRYDPLEVFRNFRTTCFNEIDVFYEKFFVSAAKLLGKCLNDVSIEVARNGYLESFGFYSVNDRIFRYFRDKLLTSSQYESVMFSMMDSEGFKLDRCMDLWVSADDLRVIHDAGHLIGLHSDSHPNDMAALSREEQHSEYHRNLQFLNSVGVLGARCSMSHPFGRYSDESLSVLRELEVEVGFRSDTAKIAERTELEIPRIDHIYFMH